MITDIFCTRHDLLEKKQHLADMQNITDMQWYAAAWKQLADEFEQIDWKNTAAECRSRGDHYGQFVPGEYVKIVEGPFAEMIQVGQ